MKQFRLLRPDEIECRVQKCSAKGVTVLLYKTARTDADLLDETVGPENWQNDFKLVDGTLYGGIGVDYGRGAVWKWDAGTESNTEAEKGRASDAFKRAGFKHGIGRELYSAPFVFIPAGKCNVKESKRTDKYGNPVFECYDNFEVASIDYDDDEHISGLVITLKGSPVFEWGGTLPTSADYVCADCGKKIYPSKTKNGETWAAADIARYSERGFGRCLCVDCMKKAKDET